MKKTSIILIIIGLVLLVASLVVAEITKTSMLESWKSYSQENYSKTEKSIDSTDIKKITLKSTNDQVKVVSSEAKEPIKIEYYISDNVSFDIDVVDGELIINKQDKLKWQWFSFGFWFDQSVVLYIPSDTEFSYYLKTSNGSIEVSDINTKKLQVLTSNGLIGLNNITAGGEVLIETSNAKIDIQGLIAKGLDVSTGNGLISLENVSVDQVKAETSNGKIEFKSLKSDDINIGTSNGWVGGSIIGQVDDYRKDIKTSNGSISINDIEYGKLIDPGNGTKTLKVTASNAVIKIDFVD